MAVADLLRLTRSAGVRKIIVDGFSSVELLKRISSYDRVVVLFAFTFRLPLKVSITEPINFRRLIRLHKCMTVFCEMGNEP